jgi:hypothetical protein
MPGFMLRIHVFFGGDSATLAVRAGQRVPKALRAEPDY